MGVEGNDDWPLGGECSMNTSEDPLGGENDEDCRDNPGEVGNPGPGPDFWLWIGEEEADLEEVDHEG